MFRDRDGPPESLTGLRRFKVFGRSSFFIFDLIGEFGDSSIIFYT